MPYLGNEPGAITDAFTDTFTGDGSETAFTLTQASTTNSVFVRIHGVMQRNGTDFNVDGTTLTFTTAPPNASNNIVVQFFTIGSVQAVADNAITLAKLAGGTDGNIISFDASGDPAFVATGNDGQVLTSAGAGAAPAFETIASADSVLISTTTASSSANLSIALSNATFSSYCFILERIVPATDNVSMHIRTSTDGGSNYDNTGGNYLFGANFNVQGVAHGGISGSSETSLIVPEIHSNIGSSTGEGLSGQFWVYGAGLTNTYTLMTGHFAIVSSAPNPNNFTIGGYRGSAADVDAVQFIMTSGAIESGRIKLYGYK